MEIEQLKAIAKKQQQEVKIRKIHYFRCDGRLVIPLNSRTGLICWNAGAAERHDRYAQRMINETPDHLTPKGLERAKAFHKAYDIYKDATFSIQGEEFIPVQQGAINYKAGKIQGWLGIMTQNEAELK